VKKTRKKTATKPERGYKQKITTSPATLGRIRAGSGREALLWKSLHSFLVEGFRPGVGNSALLMQIVNSKMGMKKSGKRGERGKKV